MRFSQASAAALLVSIALAEDGPPAAPVHEVTDTYFGTSVVDPYRWMEDLKSPETAAWIKGQADFARRRLDALPLRAELLKRLGDLSNASVQVSGVRCSPRVENGSTVRWFYFRLGPGENSPKLYVKDGLDGAERLLVDPESLGDKSTHFSIGEFSPSQDGRLVSYQLAAGGSETGEIRVLDADTGRDLGERIDRVRFGSCAWLPDGKSFLCNRLQPMKAGAPETDLYRNSRVYLHVLGAPPDKDKAVFGCDVSPDVRIDPAHLPFAYAAIGSKYLIGEVNSGVSTNSTFYVAPIASLGDSPVPWRKVVDLTDEVSNVDLHGDDLYALTYKATPRFKVVRTSVEKPDMATAQTVFTGGEAVVRATAAAKDALYVQTRDGGIGRLWRLGWTDAAPTQVALPFDGAVTLSASDPRRPGLVFLMTSWTKSAALYSFDPATGAVADTKLKPLSPVDFSAVESTEVKVKSHDGAMIPLSIVRLRGMKLDGSNPTYLTGYGAYGSSSDPRFIPTRLAWLERGGVVAEAHVRGGGEYGEEWHLAGCKATKPNTWKDFIACAEYLIREKYTSPAHLAGEGTSAGGVLIGNAVAERPDLFGAAVFNVCMTDTLRSETSSNGVPNIPEFGTVKTEDGFRGLFAMDAYAKIKPGTAYPAVLLTTGINDPRVPPWMSAKMAARLQAATTSGKPVFLRVDYDAGHGIGSTRRQRTESEADTYAFLLQQLGGK